jgi:opacity protein-like surface antigen
MGFVGSSGPFQDISPGVYGSVYVGMYFGSRLALELGFLGSVHQERFSYDVPSSLMMWGLTLDVRYNLIRPAWRSRFIPYLQAGVGVYGLVGDSYDEYGSGSSTSLATGGGFQLGGGVDLFVSRWLTVGARVLYRGIVLGQMRCSDGCLSNDPADRSYLHAITGELNAAIVF